MTKKTDTPAIRFKGFSDTWEQRKLGDMMNVTSVKRIHQSDWTDSGVRFLRARDIVAAAKNEEPDDYLYISKEKYEEYSALSGKVDVSDLLVTGVGTIGVPYLVRNLEPLYFKDGNIIWFQNSNKIDGKFLFYSFSAEQIQGFVNESAGIGTVGTYTIESGKKTPISLPNQIEQAKVGELFQQLDNLITLHQRKYEKLHNIKKSMLEKMFPKNGSNVPEIRFKGFTEAWEQRKLGDCFTERVESMPDGELISVTINDGIKKFSELGRHDNSNDDKSKYKKVCIGDIAYNSMRMWQGASGYSPYEGIVSPAYTVLSPNSGINSKCLAYQFKLPEMIHTFQINSQGITSDNWNLKYPALSEIEIFVSRNEKEQAKISEYFEGLDRLITLHQRELEKLQNIKKSMLEKMFVQEEKRK